MLKIKVKYLYPYDSLLGFVYRLRKLDVEMPEAEFYRRTGLDNKSEYFQGMMLRKFNLKIRDGYVILCPIDRVGEGS